MAPAIQRVLPKRRARSKSVSAENDQSHTNTGDPPLAESKPRRGVSSRTRRRCSKGDDNVMTISNSVTDANDRHKNKEEERNKKGVSGKKKASSSTTSRKTRRDRSSSDSSSKCDETAEVAMLLASIGDKIRHDDEEKMNKQSAEDGTMEGHNGEKDSIVNNYDEGRACSNTKNHVQDKGSKTDILDKDAAETNNADKAVTKNPKQGVSKVAVTKQARKLPARKSRAAAKNSLRASKKSILPTKQNRKVTVKVGSVTHVLINDDERCSSQSTNIDTTSGETIVPKKKTASKKRRRSSDEANKASSTHSPDDSDDVTERLNNEIKEEESSRKTARKSTKRSPTSKRPGKKRAKTTSKSSDTVATNGHNKATDEEKDGKVAAKKLSSRQRYEKAYEDKYGPKSRRTCPSCKKVFPYVASLSYHLEHKICEMEKPDAPFPILHPGERFITPYGVVEVVLDNRIPSDYGTSTISEEGKKVFWKKFYRWEKTQQAREDFNRLQNALDNRKRREKLKELYLQSRLSATKDEDKEVMSSDDVWKLYCKNITPGEILRGTRHLCGYFKEEEEDRARNIMMNPNEPRDSYPDRIVEVVLVKDQRQRITYLPDEQAGRGFRCVGDERTVTKSMKAVQEQLILPTCRREIASNKAEAQQKRGSGELGITTTSSLQSTSRRYPLGGMRLFLPRRTLTLKYCPLIPLTSCALCGTDLSKPGVAMHMKGSVCIKKSKRLGEKINERIIYREKLMRNDENYPKQGKGRCINKKRSLLSPEKLEQERQRDRLRKVRKRTRPNKSIYSGLFVFLRFKRGGGFHSYSSRKRRKTRSRKSIYPETFNYLLFRKERTNNLSPLAKHNEDKRLQKLQAMAQSPPEAKPKPKPKSLLDEILFEENLHKQRHTLFNLNGETISPLEKNNGLQQPTDKPILSSDAMYPSILGYLRVMTIDKSQEKRKRKRLVSSEESADGKDLMDGKDSIAPQLEETEEPVSPAPPDKINPPKKKRRRRSPIANPRPTPRPVIVDMMVLVEEIDTGRYPSMKRFEGEHSDSCAICQKKGTLFCCEFCSNAEHMECLRERLTVREPEPDDDFMCHKCIQTILARRARAEKRRLKKRDHVLSKAGIAPVAELNLGAEHTITTSLDGHNPSEPVLTATAAGAHAEVAPPAMRAAANVTREIHWKDDLASHVDSYEACPTGGPGGLICCNSCTASYSRLLSDTSKEMERQTISKVGREVSEMLELLRDAQLRMRQAVDVARANDERRSLLNSNEIETNSSRIINFTMSSGVNTSDVGMLDIVQICNQSSHAPV